jgi:hypothetical protein
MSERFVLHTERKKNKLKECAPYILVNAMIPLLILPWVHDCMVLCSCFTPQLVVSCFPRNLFTHISNIFTSMEYMGSKQAFSTNKEENGWRRNSPIELKVHKNDVLASAKRLVIWSKIIMCRTIYLCSPGIAASCEDHHPLYGKWWTYSRPLDSFSFPSLRHQCRTCPCSLPYKLE